MNAPVAHPLAVLRSRIDNGTATVGIIGLGYVGLPLMLAATTGGFKVLGYDVDAGRIERLNRGESPLRHLPAAEIASRRKNGMFEATSDPKRLAEPDVLIICVPTPLSPTREPDLGYIQRAGLVIASQLRPGQLVVLESTTYPGTTTEFLKPTLEVRGLTSGRDFLLAFSPEREDPGNANFTTSRIPKVVGGDGEAALHAACAFYGKFLDQVVPVSSPECAEAVKITENVFRAVNIALVNELKIVFQKMGINVFEVIEAAKTKPFGFMPFYPGPGLGGHCIPIDPFYLSSRARMFGVNTRFIELAGEVNSDMPAYVVTKTAEYVDMKLGKALSRSRVLVAGIAYKKNIDDLRESPALAIIGLLRARGCDVSYYDPYIPVIQDREHPLLDGMESVPFDADTLSHFDAAIVVTDHDDVDWQHLVDHVRLVVDTRNIAARIGANADRVFAA